MTILLALGLAGCQEQENPTGATRENATSESTPSDSKGAAAREAASEDDLVVDTVTTGLNVPWEMRFLPTGDLLVTERTGRVLRIALPGGEQVPVGQIDVTAVGESGLLGFDLDPEFPDQPYVYAAYTYSNRGSTANRLSRFTLEEDSLDEEKALLDGIPAARIHDGSRVAFGPDGYLWMTMGEGGRSSLAQDRASLAGKVLRVDREGRPAPENPFGTSVFTWGHRNPQGLAFHPQTGQAFVTEHGPSENDEINGLVAGENYGWPLVGGVTGAEEFHDPIYTWTPTIAPADASFYTSDLIPGWQGSFLFVTLKEQDLRRLEPADEQFTGVSDEQVLFDGSFGRLRALAVDEQGTLYLATSNRDGRGNPTADDDRILRVRPK